MSVLKALRLSHAPVCAFAAVGMFWGVFAAYVPVLKAQIGADDALFGLLLLGTSMGLVSTMLLAPAFDRALRDWAMPVSTCLLAFAFLFPGLATAPVGFFLAMVAAGMASGLTDVIMNARVADLEAQHTRPLMNANHGAFSLAYAMGALASGFAREAGWPPVAMFALVTVAALLLATQMRMAAQSTDDEDGTRERRFPYATVILCGAVVMIAFMTEAAVESWSALHVERTLGGGAAEGALGPTMLGLTMALGRFSGQAVSERFRDVTVIFWATLMAATGAFVAATAPVPLVAYLGFAILGLGVSVIGPLGLALTGRMVPPSVRTTAIARAAVIGFMGFFFAPAAMGMISQFAGLRVAFGMLGLAALMVLPLLFVIHNRSA